MTRILNANLFLGGKFETGGIEFDKTITAIGPEVKGEGMDAKGAYLIPGLIDIHTHGAMDADASDGDIKGLERMSRYYAKDGVTSWCPTTMTLPEDELREAMISFKEYVRPSSGAKIAGIHMEGPFVNKEKCGAQNPANIHKPDAEMFKRLNDASGGIIKLITIACEEEGAKEFIKEIRDICTISIGHTSTDYFTAMRAFELGARHITHMYNAMPPLHHREPGLIAAAFDSGVTAEIITDGLHVHSGAIRIAKQLFGDRLCIISDSLRCAGMPDGDYTLGGLDITMRDGLARLKGQETIAGSAIHLMEGLKRTVSFGIPLEEAVYAATTAPAKVIGMDKKIGALDVGMDADLVLLDNELNVESVYIDGSMI